MSENDIAERLAGVERAVASLETRLTSVLDQVVAFGEQAEGLFAELEKSPIAKMLGLKR